MAQTTGRAGTVKIGTDTVGELKGWGFDESSETYGTNEATINTPAPAMTFEAGPTSWTGSIEVLWDEADAAQAALTSGTSVTVVFYMEGEVTGDEIMTGTAIINSVGVAGAVDGMVTRNFGLQGSDALVSSQVPA